MQHYHDCHLMSKMDMLPKIIPQFSDIIILSIQNGMISVHDHMYQFKYSILKKCGKNIAVELD